MNVCKNQCILFAFFSLFAAKLNFQFPKVVQQHTKDVVKNINDLVANFIGFLVMK